MPQTLVDPPPETVDLDRKSTRLNSSHSSISYAVFCLKKKIATRHQPAALLRRPDPLLGVEVPPAGDIAPIDGLVDPVAPHLDPHASPPPAVLHRPQRP